MSPVLRPGPSRKIHTQESFFWSRKLGHNQEWNLTGISDLASSVRVKFVNVHECTAVSTRDQQSKKARRASAIHSKNCE